MPKKISNELWPQPSAVIHFIERCRKCPYCNKKLPRDGIIPPLNAQRDADCNDHWHSEMIGTVRELVVKRGDKWPRWALRS